MRTNKGHGEEPKKRDALVDMGYETEDINMKGIGKGAAWFFGFATLSIVMVYPIILAMNRGFFQSSPSRAPLVRRLPAEGTPLLQSNMTVRLDTAELRQAEAQEMTTSGWVDKNKGIVHMPVDRAMDMYLKQSSGLINFRIYTGPGRTLEQQKRDAAESRNDFVTPGHPSNATPDSTNQVHEGGQP